MSMRARRFHTLGIVFIAATPCSAAPAVAQVAASLSLDSDYQVRGVSVSDGEPVLSASASYDHASGVYAGVSAMAEETAHSGVQMLGHIEYAGLVMRNRTGMSWDVGVSNSNFTEYKDMNYHLNYTEIYAGLSFENLSGHVYYSPNYFGDARQTLYVELNGAMSLASAWRVFGHVGALTELNGQGSPEPRRERFDLRAGVAREFKGCEMRLTFTGASPEVDQSTGRERTLTSIVAGATLFF